jgi:hypothetical protein
MSHRPGTHTSIHSSSLDMQKRQRERERGRDRDRERDHFQKSCISALLLIHDKVPTSRLTPQNLSVFWHGNSSTLLLHPHLRRCLHPHHHCLLRPPSEVQDQSLDRRLSLEMKKKKNRQFPLTPQFQRSTSLRLREAQSSPNSPM